MRIIHGAGPTVRGYNPLEDFSANLMQTPSTVGGTSGTQTVNEVTYTTQVGTSTVNLFRLDVSESNLRPGKSFESATPSICTVNAAGEVSRVADGLCKVNVITPVGTRQYSQTLATTGGATVRTGMSSLASGSLLKYLTDQRNALLAATSPGATRQRAYANADGTGGANASNLLLRNDVGGWTATPFSHLLGTRYISAKHSIHTAHVIGVGPYNTYYTTTAGGHVYEWTPTTDLVVNGSTVRRTDYGKVIGTDTVVIYEPSANAATLTKLPPVNLSSYLPTCGDSLVDVPVWFRRYNSATANEGRWIQAASVLGSGGMRVPVNAAAKTFSDFQDVIQFTGGDSGTPVFACVNGEAMLLYSVSFSNGSGWCYASNQAEINTAMNTLSAAYVAAGGTDASNGSYAAATVSLSGFNLY